jgi:hypothetical protein
MNSLWAKHPPLQIMIQSYLGIEGQKEIKESKIAKENNNKITHFEMGEFR